MIWEFLRGISAEYGKAFWATEEEIRARIPKDLPLFLRLSEWYHNDLANEENPGEVETFRMIAAALESGNPDLYQATKKPNNHWRNWPDGGAL